MSVSSRRPGAKTPTDFAAAVQRLLPIVRMGGRASHADSIRAQREIGEIVLKFIPDKPKHGDGAYAGLGKAIGHGGEWVYRARCFALRYTAKEMETLLRVAPHISFAHVIQLLSVRDKELRVRFEAQLGAEHWTVDQLKHAIQKKFGLRRTNSGAKPKLPARPQDGLQEMLDVVIALRRRWGTWQVEAAKPNRSSKSRALIGLLEKLDHEAREFSQSVSSTAASKIGKQRLT